MRAQFVFENIEFERGGRPRKSLGLGGVNFEEIQKGFIDEYRKKWHDFLQQFVGKTITGIMDSWSGGSRGDWKEHSVEVKEIEDRFYNGDVSILGTDGQRYSLLTRDNEFIVESVNFTKTGNPKAGLDIGGIKLSHIRKEIIDQAKDDWIQWVYDYIIGKTITGKFNRIAKVIEDGYEFTGEGWGNYTVKVRELVASPQTINMDDHALFIVGEDDYQYVVPIDDKKIWIKS